jgi:hypothetical protein
MPYIDIENRKNFTQAFELGKQATSEGELNYILTQVCRGYLKREKVRYNFLNQIIGALECCKLEFYRRIVSDYENFKIAAHGDVD